MVDVILGDDLDIQGAEWNDPIAELEQDIYHRLITPAGYNIDDPDFGLGLVQMLGGPEDPALASRVDAECKKDDRVDGTQTIVERLSAAGDPNGVYRITVNLSPQGSVVLEASLATGAKRVQ